MSKNVKAPNLILEESLDSFELKQFLMLKLVVGTMI